MDRPAVLDSPPLAAWFAAFCPQDADVAFPKVDPSSGQLLTKLSGEIALLRADDVDSIHYSQMAAMAEHAGAAGVVIVNPYDHATKDGDVSLPAPADDGTANTLRLENKQSCHEPIMASTEFQTPLLKFGEEDDDDFEVSRRWSSEWSAAPVGPSIREWGSIENKDLVIYRTDLDANGRLLCVQADGSPLCMYGIGCTSHEHRPMQDPKHQIN